MESNNKSTVNSIQTNEYEDMLPVTPPNREILNNGRFYQYLSTFTAAASVISIGVNLGWTSPYLPTLQSNSSSIPTSVSEGTWCATAPLGGAIIGALLVAKFSDRFGRKKLILIAAPITFFSYIGIAFAKNIWLISFLRTLVGMTDGSLYTALPMYVGEIVDPEIRGFTSSLLYTLNIVGLLLINSLGPFVDIFTSSLIVAAIPVFQFGSFIFMPESPYHSVRVGNFNEAEASLMKLKGTENARKELLVIKEVVENQNKIMNEGKITDLITIPSNREACYIYFALLFANGMSGRVPMMFFTTEIFKSSESTIDPTLSVIVYTAVELIVVVSVTSVIDKFGKKPLIIVSCIGCSVSTLALAIYFYLKETGSTLVYSLDWLPITSLTAHNILFNMGIGYCTMNYLSELFPMNIKPIATCAGEICTVSFSIFTAQFFKITQSHFGMSLPFFCFAFVCAVAVFFVYKIVPETKGKSLMEVQELLISICEKNKRTSQKTKCDSIVSK